MFSNFFKDGFQIRKRWQPYWLYFPISNIGNIFNKHGIYLLQSCPLLIVINTWSLYNCKIRNQYKMSCIRTHGQKKADGLSLIWGWYVTWIYQSPGSFPQFKTWKHEIFRMLNTISFLGGDPIKPANTNNV